MDLTLINTTKSNVCRCCLQRQCFRDISSDYYVSGQKEVYQDMLKDTFDIHITLEEAQGSSIHICEDCVLRLRDATAFKKMVVHSIKNYSIFFNNHSDTGKDNKFVKQERKSPSLPVDTHFSSLQFTDEHSVDEDDEILARVKVELSQNRRLDDDCQNKAILEQVSREEDSRVKKSTRKKCKIKSNESETSIDKVKTKIIERRGSGPILRQNSLKLLTNSTLCVFQYDRSRYRCFCCKEPFSDIHTLKEHTANTHTLKHIEKKIILQQNRLVKVEISELCCKLCNVLLNNLTELRDHLTEKHNLSFTNEDLLVPFKIEKDLSCQICSEKFTVFRLLNIHMNQHFQKQVCHICGAAFPNLVFLNLHKTRSHRPFKCKKCESVFSTKLDRKNHEVSVHKVSYERKLRFPCPYCNERFFQENYRVLHLVEKHGFTKPEYKCLVCSKAFVTKSLCNNHLKNVHLKERTHECEVCHSFFYSRSDVNRHKITHTGEKRFSCSVCSNLFASKDSLRRHFKRSHGGVP